MNKVSISVAYTAILISKKGVLEMNFRFQAIFALFRTIGAVSMASFIFSGCEPLEQGMQQEAAEKSSLPVFRTITDVRGRTIDAEVVARGQDTITFLKVSDGSRHEFPINRLSAADRTFVQSLPVSKRKDTKFAGGSRAHNFKKAELESLKKEEQELFDELRTLSSNTMRRRSLRSQQSRLKKRIEAVEAELREN